MITTIDSKPDARLSAFVDSYIFSSAGQEIVKIHGTWPASNETSLVFYLSDLPHYHEMETSAAVVPASQWVVGILTHGQRIVSFEGKYSTFVIRLKANGFNALFGIAASELTNQVYVADQVLGKRIETLFQQLLNAKDVLEMAHFSDQCLLEFLGKRNNIRTNDGITVISNMLSGSERTLDIEKYASHANMSLRTFYRQFNEQVGISPKLYCRLLRFNNVILLKARYPQKKWTSIAYECNYFDQMHMIRDFKDFANVTPSTFALQYAGMQDEVFISVNRD